MRMILRPAALTCLVALLAVQLLPAQTVEAPETMIETRYRAYMCYSLGRLMEVDGYLADALVQYRRAAAFDPDGCDPGVATARVLLGMQRLDDALAEITVARGICPDDIDALAVHSRILIAMEEFELAHSLLEGADSGPVPGEIIYLTAQTLVHQGLYDEAEELYRRRAATDSLDPMIAVDHARVLMLLERTDEAIAELRRAVDLDPSSATAQVMLARVLLGLGRTEEGIPFLEKVIRGETGRISDYVTLSRAYGVTDRREDAESLLLDATVRWPNSQRIFTELGAIYYDRGAVGDALEAFAKVLEINPQSIRALNFIAYTLAEEGRDLNRALDYAKEAVALSPDNPRVLDTLGWVYYHLGRFEEAREYLEAAVAIDGAPAAVFLHLGDLHEATGDVDAAVSAWREALRLEPGLGSVAERLENAGALPAPDGENP